MAKSHLLLFVALAASFAVSSSTVTKINSSATPMVYEMLEQYNFPSGILPEGVQNYTLNPNGSFVVTLLGDCDIDVAGYTLQYERKIQGSIQSMLISGLEGVSVNVAINRVGIKAVERDGDQLKFDAGVISKSFPVRNFIASPRCSQGPGFLK